MSIRFAPSPTGRFHIGNLRTAWIAQELAHKLKLPLVIRFEDIDKPRVVAGAQKLQLEDMAALNIHADKIIIQSQNYARHFKLFAEAQMAGEVYPCTCSRKEVQEALAQLASAPQREVANEAEWDATKHPAVYNGVCREKTSTSDHENSTIAWRFRNSDPTGAQDFIVARTDVETEQWTPAYIWACAIDDYDGDHQWLVRAWDLAPARFHQQAVFDWLGRLEKPKIYPQIFHTALVTQDDGHRLEKRTKGVTLPELIEKGWTSDKLISAFKRSFQETEHRQIKLSELLAQ